MWVLVLVLAGCAQDLPRYRTEALVKYSAARVAGGDVSAASEFASITEALEAGDRLLEQRRVPEAELYYLLALRKAELAEQSLRDERVRQEAQRLKEEEKTREAERQRRLDEIKRKEIEARERESRAARKKMESVVAAREMEREKEIRHLPATHTVKRGETLPQIAARSDVYGDANMWPLIYRANRDQIRDPGRIWPGQVLRIPRNASREDVAEALRRAQERQLQ